MFYFFIISLVNVYKPITTQCITSSPNLKAAKPCTSNCHQQYQLQKRKTNIVYQRIYMEPRKMVLMNLFARRE